MKITATVDNAAALHEVMLATAGTRRSLAIPAKTGGGGSSINGGEFLMLALATCYCNDLYREAARMGLAVEGVQVEASADFDGVGLAATNILYRAKIASPEADDRIADLLRQTDVVAEVHNTVRSGVPVRRVAWTADD